MNSKTAISNWKDALLKYAVPGIVFLVALRQIYLCETDGLLRWKGGGFGMYSEYHVNHRYMQILPPPLGTEMRDQGGQVHALLHECRLYARPEHFRNLSEYIEKKSGIQPQLILWVIDFDPDTYVLGWKKLCHYSENTFQRMN